MSSSNRHPQDMLQSASTAAQDGNIEGLTMIIDEMPEVLTATDADGETLLTLACRWATGDIAIPPIDGTPEQHQAVDLIIEKGADLNAANNDGRSALHCAAMAGHNDLADRLIKAGASCEGHLYGHDGGSPLALALFYAKTETGRILANPATPDNLRHAASLGHDLDRFAGSSGGLTPEASSGLDFYRPLKLFPDWERSFETQEVLDEALTWASRNNQVGSLAGLVDMGANVNANPYRGTALLWAVYSDKVEAATWLLDHGADPDLVHDFGGAGHGVQAVAMHLAAQHGALNCLRLLLERGADTSIVDGAHGGTPEDWAHFSGTSDSVAILQSAR
ncbi:MAG: ankyrin repeat domain-containing protein [Pseudomonadota bacterium]